MHKQLIFELYTWVALILAAGEGHCNAVATLLKSKYIQLEAKNKFGKNALILSCEMGHLDVVKLLIEHKADINASSTRGLSGLMLACVKGHTEIVKFLIENNADVLIRSPDSSTALSMACSGGRLDIVNLLIERELGVLRDVQMALMNACQHDNKDNSMEIVKVR